MRSLIVTGLLVLAFTLSCAHAAYPSQPPIIPVSGTNGVSNNSSRALWAIWEVTISDDRTSAEIVPLRLAEMHLNALGFLEDAPCKKCLTVGKITLFAPNELEVEVTLTHPYPSALGTTAFDVRGIFISTANYMFPPSGRSIAWGDTVSMLLNYDGYTSLYNPTEYPSSQPGPKVFRYIPGKKATGGDLSSTLNPFVAYRKDIPRMMFLPGASETKMFRIRAPKGPIHFGYAVDASWVPVEKVVDPLVDFPSSANCQEGCALLADVGSGLAVEDGGMADIFVRVLDHQAHASVKSVSMYSPQIFDGEVALSLASGNVEPYVPFAGVIKNDLKAPTGTYPLLIRAIDSTPDPNLGPVDAWQVVPVRIKVQEGWARIWKRMAQNAGSFTSEIRDVEVDSNQDVIVVGNCQGTVDMDPGPGEMPMTSEYPTGFVSKFAPSGEMKWVVTWGPSMYKNGIGARLAAVDNQNNIYVGGTFTGTVDIDPGPAEDIRTTPLGFHYPYLCKFDPTGIFRWAQNWGEGGINQYYVGITDMAVGGDGTIDVTGDYKGTFDFDPGSGQDIFKTQNVSTYLTQYTSNGDYVHTVSFGPVDAQDVVTVPSGLAIDKSNAIYIAGAFEDVVDFDPGNGVEKRTSKGGEDAYLSKFTSSSLFLWTKTWGGTAQYDNTGDVAVDRTGNIIVDGHFGDTVDFDPGSGEHSLTSYDGTEYFLRLDRDGNFKWVLTFEGGGTMSEPVLGTDCWDNILIGGRTTGLIDFDPGPGQDLHSSDQLASCLIKLSPSGDFNWARSWVGGGQSIQNEAYCVNSDAHGNIYLGGDFTGLIDFDPGDGVDNHDASSHYEGYLVRTTPEGLW